MVRTYGDVFSEVLSRVGDIKLDIWCSKCDMVDEEGIFRLLHYQPVTEARYRTPLLIVYAFINRPYVMDLQPEVSVVRRYMEAGFDVYMIDWGYPTTADQFLNLDDYAEYIDRSARYICKATGVPKLNLHGYCLGGTLSACYTAVHPERVRNLIVQTTPIDFHTNNMVARWAQELDADKIVEAYHSAPGPFLNIGFLLVDPVNLIIGKYAGFLDMIESKHGMANFLSMDKWVFDSPAVPGAAYRQYIKEWYHDNSIMKGQFRMMGETVELENISVPLLVLAAKFDHIVPPDSQKAILALAASRDKDCFEMAKGHVGITTSRESHREYWPRVVKWIEERSEGRSEARFRNRQKAVTGTRGSR